MSVAGNGLGGTTKFEEIKKIPLNKKLFVNKALIRPQARNTYSGSIIYNPLKLTTTKKR